jgi:hypothetical protein
MESIKQLLALEANNKLHISNFHAAILHCRGSPLPTSKHTACAYLEKVIKINTIHQINVIK